MTGQLKRIFFLLGLRTGLVGGRSSVFGATGKGSVSLTQTASVPSGTFNNPVLYEDFADNDIFRVNVTYYFSASNLLFSPGAPILRSVDRVIWEFVGLSVPLLNFGDLFN